MAAPVIQICDLDFRYALDLPLVLEDLTLTIGPQSRCLLVGANGAGKTTLLRVIGGKHMVDADQVQVLGRSAFHDTALISEVAFMGGNFPLEIDLRVAEILDNIDADPDRQQTLIEILGVDLEWHMHRVSDGQRRRVQLLLGLLRPSKLFLLDEITTDLDLLARTDLLAFLRKESETRGATLLYATHILDRLEDWATHLALIENKRVALHRPLDQIDELKRLQAAGIAAPLSRLVESWLRRESERS